MSRIGPLSNALVQAVAEGRAVLFVGAGFSHGVTGLDWGALLDTLKPQIQDTSGWDNLDALDRAELFVQAHGRERLESELAALLPSVDALADKVTEFHKALVSQPFPVIVTTNYDGLVEATLQALDEPYRLVVEEAEVAPALAANDGCRVVVKMHGDLLLGDTIVLTRDDYMGYEARRPAMVALLQSLFLSRAFFFYGFGLSDPNFLLIFNAVLRKQAVGGGAWALMREPNHLLARYWQSHKVDVISGNTYGDLERYVETLGREVAKLRRDRFDLTAVLANHFPDEQHSILRLLEEVQERFVRQLERLEPFTWVRLPHNELESYRVSEGDDALGAFRVLRALERAGLPVPAKVYASAAELLGKLNYPEDARAAADTCLRVLKQTNTRATPELRGALGRVFSRLGDLERARPFLERALAEGDQRDVASRTAELAWLLRCVLDRMDQLRERRRERAARDVLARFLKKYAGFFELAARQPAVDDEAWVWSAYYANHRLGRVFAMASELAGQSGEVYALQAIERLVRALELAPGKPEPYRILRPLLVAPRTGKGDVARWARVVAAAPADIQRKLRELFGEVAAPEPEPPPPPPRPTVSMPGRRSPGVSKPRVTKIE
jgi:tetratricopeptide (TPR) repeat protein